jgi:hypothetical protein
MKKELIIIFATISTFGFSQNLDKNNKTLKPLITKSAKIVFKDSTKIVKNFNTPTKIYLQLPAEKTDYFKYIFPFVTLLLGIGVNRLIDYRNDSKKIKKSGKRWLSELRVLKNPIEKQIANIETFLVEHNNKERYTFPRPELVTTLDCEVFSSLDKSEIVEYLEKYKKNSFQEAVENSSEINGFVAILKSTYENFKRIFEEYKQNISTHTISVSRNLQGLMKEFGIYSVHLEQEIGKDPIDDARYRPILDLMNIEIAPFLENNNYDIYKLEKDFFKPLVVILSRLRQDQRIYPMLDHARNCITEIKAIQMEKYYLDINFRNLKDSYNESKKWLPEVVKTLE